MIEVRGLTKTFDVPCKPPGLFGSLRNIIRRETRPLTAVDDVSFSIEPHERVGFLGPNGAGKTTTLKVLSGLLVPTRGEARVLGHEPWRRNPDFLSRITLVMGQKVQLLWDLPARETFELNRALYDLDRTEYRRTLDGLVDLLDLAKVMERPVRGLSLGERMKCELAAALLHRPEVLFLDEPTIGLDVTMQAAVRTFIREWNEQHGATVLLTSHYMADIVALCPRVILIDHGRVRYDGSLEQLMHRYAPDRRVTLRPLRPLTAEEVSTAHPFAVRDGCLEATVPGNEVKAVLDRALRELPVADLTVEEPPVEEVIARLFEEISEPPA